MLVQECACIPINYADIISLSLASTTLKYVAIYSYVASQQLTWTYGSYI